MAVRSRVHQPRLSSIACPQDCEAAGWSHVTRAPIFDEGSLGLVGGKAEGRVHGLATPSGVGLHRCPFPATLIPAFVKPGIGHAWEDSGFPVPAAARAGADPGQYPYVSLPGARFLQGLARLF